MSNYNKSTNFAVKDTLTSGDPDKVVSGVEIDNEFNSIASAIGSKIDKVSAATANNFAALNANGNIIDSDKNESDFADASDTQNSLSVLETDIENLETDIDDKANKVISGTENNFAALDSNGDIKDSGEDKTTIINISSPTGAVTAFAANAAPNGWLECDGSAVSRSTYSSLFSVIGTSFGLGDGTNTFNLPDLRGEFIRGWDNGRGVDDGRSFGSAQLDQMQRITGEFNAHGVAKGGRLSTDGAFSDGGSGGRNGAEADGNNKAIAFNSANSPNARVSSTTDGETRPRNVALMYIIKT